MEEVKNLEKYGFGKAEEVSHLIEEIMRLSLASIEALRSGFDEHSAFLVCTLVLPYVTADAVAITDKEKILGYVGVKQEDYPQGVKIKTSATRQVLNTGKELILLSEKEIGFPETNYEIKGAIIEPIIVTSKTIGTMKYYFRDPNKITRLQHMTARGLGQLISTLVQSQETENQKKLTAQMEVKMLQSQINPHFLFNTLNSIMSLIRSDPDQAREMLQNFSGFYRSTLEQDTEVVTLTEELQNTNRYVALQKMRFGDERLSFEVKDNSKLADKFKIPPFVLQPVVENSITHAMPKSGKLDIEIEINKKDNILAIDVKDNGQGMSRKLVSELFISDDIETEGLGVAMKNVYGRIKGFYGDNAKVSVKSLRWVGTTVSFELPCDKTK